MQALAGYEETLRAIAEACDDVIVMTAENRGPIRSLPAALGPRFVDVGICEQTLVGAAAGLALRGRRPVVHALAAFLVMRAFEFIRTDVGIPRLPVKLVGYLPGLLSEANGPTHQAIEDVSLMRGIPGMQVFCPADAWELSAALPDIVASEGPWYVRYNASPALVPHRDEFEPGRAELLSEGDGVALLTYGVLLAEAARARTILESRGVPVRLLNMRCLKPVDEAAILESARRAELLVTLEDHFVCGGLFSIVSETLARHGVARRVFPIGFQERWFKPALLPELVAWEGLSGARIAGRILEALLETKPPRREAEIHA
jgi:transketolase